MGATIFGDATQIRSDQPAMNFGSDVPQIIGTTASPAILRGLQSYSLSSIPAGSTITSVSLRMTVRSTDGSSDTLTGVMFNLHQLTASFTEGNGAGAGVNSGDASWNVRGPGGAAWTTAGGDFSPTVLSSFGANAGNAAGTSYTFATGTDFVAAVQSALDSNTPLYLMIKLGNEDTTVRKAFFFESDDGNAAGRPQLIVEYVPEPGPVVLAALAGAGWLARRRR